MQTYSIEFYSVAKKDFFALLLIQRLSFLLVNESQTYPQFGVVFNNSDFSSKKEIDNIKYLITRHLSQIKITNK
ncbi:hypothetical protein FK004_02330 [Flavobacterium kingsejongi]|uniref:Uncharacterized protein n=1 Tax=Flavobacterium kingsejongi TaxID=1678728 RepID=A0A2S1LK48_9FLAO|nr:hypothetical protein FK004_02330 [Flavobacterium kingsejongi]